MQTWLIWSSFGRRGGRGGREDTAGKKGDFRAQRQVSPIWQLARRMEVSMAGRVSPATPQLCSGLVFPSLQWSRGSCLFSCRPRERDSTPPLLGRPFSFIPMCPITQELTMNMKSETSRFAEKIVDRSLGMRLQWGTMEERRARWRLWYLNIPRISVQHMQCYVLSACAS